MHKGVVLAALAIGSLPLFGFQEPVRHLDCRDNQNSGDRLVRHCEMKEQTISASRGPVDVNPGQNGSVSVTGWDRSDLLVRARIDTAAETEPEARGMVSQIQVASGAGSIHANGPAGDRNHNWSVSYEIFVPRQSDVHAKSHNGSIHISDVRGTISFEAVNGSVSLQRLAGDVKGSTTNGTVNVDLAGTRWDGGGLDVATTNGAVKLAVPSNYSAHFETSTVNGGLDVDFPITVQGRLTKELSFDVGGGGATIRAVTTNGGVRIKKS